MGSQYPSKKSFDFETVFHPKPGEYPALRQAGLQGSDVVSTNESNIDKDTVGPLIIESL